MIKSNAPIGIFDSGIGGLTVASAIKEILPNEQIIYFGDTAHLPYGDKSQDAIKRYSRRIAHFLLAKGCKMIVIACNTASAAAFKDVAKLCGPDAHVVNVVDPVVDFVAENHPNDRVGIIGTKGTIGSRIYPRKLKQKNLGIEAVSAATPLLAPMIEEGFFNNYISQTIIANYLDRPALKDIRALILGCTHYPLIKKEVEKHYQGTVDIVDSASVVARSVQVLLTSEGLLHESKPLGPDQFYVSDFTTAFEKSTHYFFGQGVHLEEENIWVSEGGE